MADYDNEMKGVLFPNLKKTKENQPDCRGNVQVNGVAYRVSGWTKKDKNGGKYVSLVLQPDEKPVDAPAAQTEGDDDKIPF